MDYGAISQDAQRMRDENKLDAASPPVGSISLYRDGGLTVSGAVVTARQYSRICVVLGIKDPFK